MSDYIYIFFGVLPVVAFLYASVGHGGASGYLALMALFSFSPAVMRPTALLLNILVSLVAFILYSRATTFHIKLFAGLVAFSIPFAFVGGLITVNDTLYKQMLGAFLLVPVARFSGILPETDRQNKTIRWPMVFVIGSMIGFVSGLIGIGGGIILTPILLMLGWTTIKETAAISALFITLNSIAGLAGATVSGISWDGNLTLMVLLALVGGFLGAYYGSKYFHATTLKRILAAVLLIASVKLIFE